MTRLPPDPLSAGIVTFPAPLTVSVFAPMSTPPVAESVVDEELIHVWAAPRTIGLLMVNAAEPAFLVIPPWIVMALPAVPSVSAVVWPPPTTRLPVVTPPAATATAALE